MSTLVTVLFYLFVSQANAHGWYDKACCADKDCHPVNCDDISHNSAGDFVWHEIIFYRTSMKVSQDGGCHVCVNSATLNPLGICIYMPSES
jgi:hypothetical protein